jgi:hypothetical protein
MIPRCALAFLFATLAVTPSALAVVQFSDDFDADHTLDWTVNDNGFGTNAANFYFDYSTIGIPPAPNSNGTTRGLKLQANIDPSNTPADLSPLSGISVSPTGKSFTGDYKLAFDWWANFIGPLEIGADGSTQISTFGIMSSGLVANHAGSADGVFFAATGDSQSSFDFRAYSPERIAGYQAPDTSADPIDSHAFFFAGSRNASAQLYEDTFPSQLAPSEQSSNYPTQSGITPSGAAGFAWHRVVIEKSGSLAWWTVNGVPLVAVDTSFFATGGSNILFGHGDTNHTTNSSAELLEALQFTLIDNVRVVPEPATAALAGLAIALGLLARRSRAMA